MQKFSVGKLSELTGHPIPDDLECHAFQSCACPWCSAFRAYVNATGTEKWLAEDKAEQVHEMMQYQMESISERLEAGESPSPEMLTKLKMIKAHLTAESVVEDIRDRLQHETPFKIMSDLGQIRRRYEK